MVPVAEVAKNPALAALESRRSSPFGTGTLALVRMASRTCEQDPAWWRGSKQTRFTLPKVEFGRGAFYMPTDFRYQSLNTLCRRLSFTVK